MNEEYTIKTHQHRLACWAASRSAAASPYCRFSVQMGNDLLAHVGIDEHWSLPQIDQAFEKWHKETCLELVKYAKQKSKGSPAPFSGKEKNNKRSKDRFTYGVAAKLINCYLKVRFVHPANSTEEFGFIHPPVDRLLLNGLNAKDKKKDKAKAKLWRKYRDIGWSDFLQEDYEAVILAFKESLNGKPLWHIEKYWGGMQISK